MASPHSLVPSVLDVSSYEVCKLLYELPGIFCTRSREPLLDDLNGVNGQGEVGGDGEYLFVDCRAARVWRGNLSRLLARSHVFILLMGEEEEMGVWRARINFFVPCLALLLSPSRGWRLW